MGLKSTIKAGISIFKRYGIKPFFRQMILKFSSHNFEKVDTFLNRDNTVVFEKFSPKNEKIDGLVSVVIPCYNHEAFVADALYSIYNQSYKKIEMIVIDDCSVDGCVKIIDKLFDRWKVQERFYKLTFIKNDVNKGAHYSINTGINMCAGSYIAVLNSDDLYDSNRFEMLINVMEDKDAGLAFSKVMEIDENGMVKKKAHFSGLQDKIEKEHMFLGLCGDNLAISSGNLFFKRDVLENIGLFRDFKYVHDWDFLLRSALISHTVFCGSTCYYYRMHSTNSYLALNSMTKLCDEEMLEVSSNIFKKVYNEKESMVYSEQDYEKIIDLLYRRMVNNLR